MAVNAGVGAAAAHGDITERRRLRDAAIIAPRGIAAEVPTGHQSGIADGVPPSLSGAKSPVRIQSCRRRW